MRRVDVVYAWLLYISTLPLICSALSIRNVEALDTDRPTAGIALYFETSGSRTSEDPEVVNVLIRDPRQGNNTLIIGELNIEEEPDIGFHLPDLPPGNGYIIRIVDPSSNRVLADSATFEIFPPGTPPSENYSSTAGTGPTTSTHTVISPSRSPGASNNGDKEDGGGSQLGVIIGGAVGGFAIVVLFFVLLWLLLRKRKPKQPELAPFNPDSTPMHPQIFSGAPKDKDGVISPFFIPTADGGNAAHTPFTESIPLTPSSLSADNSGVFVSASSEKARLRAQQTMRDRAMYNASSSSSGQARSEAGGSAAGSSDNLLASRKHQHQQFVYPPSSSSGSETKGHARANSGTSARMAAARAEQLRRERERIDREIAELENQSAYSGGSAIGSAYGGVSQGSEDLVAQIAMLREQVGRIERERAITGHGYELEPPPEYVPRSQEGASPSPFANTGDSASPSHRL
ncbi:hypothetical protein CC1G_07110 [Coprinopsis cinerea okayama7|uniref:Uncharacterized protein n=1 Tax=Coprinopsis cinerea (strain Okayama-7 / 130 / ATCC MYA-4618 / FGSC 9003) TaxID=240176 RepID=A8NUI0_COPC7|nr:hypothetical protein CC1G_07110 [Coprinopsis cinerea okayama7\|eukprot:XP_001836463.2 hypothetical protein CC1G_07110 [Coprinopsis cinerea okayama7\